MNQLEDLNQRSWQHTSPLSILLGAYYLLFLILALFIHTGMSLPSDHKKRNIFFSNLKNMVFHYQLWAILIICALVICGFGYSWWRWYWIFFSQGRLHFHYRSGWLWRVERSLPYDRIQSIELRRRLLVRMLGLAEVHIESAGGENSDINVRYLKLADAQKMRSQLHDAIALAKSGILVAQDPTVGTPAAPSAEAPAAPSAGLDTPSVSALDTPSATAPNPPSVSAPHPNAAFAPAPFRPMQLYKLNNNKFLLSLFADTRFWAYLLFLLSWFIMRVLISVMADVSVFPQLKNGFLGYDFIVWFIGLALTVKAFLKPLFNNWSTQTQLIDNKLDFKQGLFTLYQQHTPLERVHAVVAEQGLIWRLFDWWRGRIVVARGLSIGNIKESRDTPIPLGSFLDIELLTWANLPELGMGSPQANHQLFVQALNCRGSEPGWSRIKPSTRIFTPFDGGYQGIYLTPTCLIARRGFFTKQIMFLPLSHVQGIRIKQGVLGRLCGFAYLEFLLVMANEWSRYTVRFLSLADAEALFARLESLVKENLRLLNAARVSTAWEQGVIDAGERGELEALVPSGGDAPSAGN